MNQEQILAEIADALGADSGPEDAITTTDIVSRLCARTGRSEQYLVRLVRGVLGRLQREGRLERVDVRRVSPVDGRNARVKGYRLV